MFSPTLPTEGIDELARDATFVAEMQDLYAALDRRVTARRPICDNRGACCAFESYGHRLYVTTVELAYFVAMRRRASATAAPPADRTPAGSGSLSLPVLAAIRGTGCCPYQQGGVCTVRTERPTGCRIFFCDPASQDWQPTETESTLQTLRGLHTKHDVPYVYVEWLTALEQLGALLGIANASEGSRAKGSPVP